MGIEYILDFSKKRLNLYEKHEALTKTTERIIASAFSWRKTGIIRFARLQLTRINQIYSDLPENNRPLRQISDTKMTAMPLEGGRIFFCIKLLGSIPRESDTEEYIQLLMNLSEEELSFWVWKMAQAPIRAIKAFKILHDMDEFVIAKERETIKKFPKSFITTNKSKGKKDMEENNLQNEKESIIQTDLSMFEFDEKAKKSWSE